MEKLECLIDYLVDELKGSKDTIHIDEAMKYTDMIKDLSDALYHVVVTEAMVEHGAEETVEKYKEHNSDWHESVESQSAKSRKAFMSFKESHPSETNRSYAEAMINDTISDIKESWQLMTTEEKSIVKAKLTGLINVM